MGRRPLASKTGERAPPSTRGNLPFTEEGSGAGARSLLPGLSEKLLGDVNAAFNGMEIANGGVKLAEATKSSQPKRKAKLTVDSSNVKMKKPKAAPRRSGRLRSFIKPVSNKDITPVMEELSSWVDNEEHVPPALDKTQIPGLGSNKKSLEAKVISLSKEVQQLKTSFEALTSKVENMENAWSRRTPEAYPSGDILHEECQKKIEALTKENADLAHKLQNAHMMYSRGNCLFGELFEKVKDIMLLFGQQVQATEMVPPVADGTDLI